VRVERPGESEEREDELIAAARAGVPRAFERLLSLHESRVLRVVRLLGIPPDDREDVAQEVFVRVFRHLDGFRRGQPFGAWVYRIAVNACHDHRKRSLRRQEAGTERDRLERAPAPVDGAEERIDRLDRRRRLERALRELSERERAVFVLCEMEGLPTAHVARALGITSITVRRHLGRARRRLQEVLTDES
jgi:RNA polymerase sigma-70 factor (ECF subfamily)